MVRLVGIVGNSMSLELARAADRAGDLRSAAQLYEEILATGEQSLELLLDLAILYWEVTDPGIAAGNHFDAEFMNIAERRNAELLGVALAQHPRSAEARFWNRYVGWLSRFDPPLTIEECEQLLREDPDVLVPALHIFTQTEGLCMEREATELLRQCRVSGTTRARYVISVLDRRLRRKKGHGDR